MSRKNSIKLWLCLLCLLPVQIVAQTLEYWFDDHYDQRATTTIATSEEVQEIRLDLRDNTKFPFGYHKLNMRVMVSGKPSAVYSSGVLKLSAGKATKLEYWVDDEYIRDKGRVKSKTISGSTMGEGNTYQFVEDLDLSDVTPGYHRLYYRTISNSGRTASAVSMTPVMVKSRYNVDAAEAQMTNYSIAVDNEEPALFSFPHSGNVVDVNHNYDGRYLSKGKHQIKLKMSNNIGASVSVQQDITVEERLAEPIITLTATEKDGLVYIRSNSVPSDNGYRIYRNDANGASKIIKSEKVGRYPTDIFYTDNPPAGTYTYCVRSLYTDIDGNSQKVKSNEVSVTVTSPLTEIGYVEGEIYYDGKRKVGFKSNIKIKAYADEFIVQSNNEGVFRMDRIPVGKELMVSLADNDYYTAGVVSVTVAKGRNHVALHVTSKTGLPVNDNINYGNLTYYDGLTWEPGMFFRLPLINTSHETWNGKICIKAYPKRYDNEEETSSDPFNQGTQVLPGSVASFQTLPFFETKNYQSFESENFQLVYNGRKEVLVPMTGLYNEGDTELYNFYVYCVKPNGAMSLVSPNNSFTSTRNNPLELLVEGGMNGEEMTERKAAYYTNLIVYYCGLVKDLDKILGKSSDVLGYAKKKLEDDYYLLTHATEENELESEGMQGVVYDMIEKSDKYSNEIKSFRGDIKPIVKECESIKTLWGYVKKSIKAVEDYSKEIASKNDYEKAIYLSQKIIDLTSDYNPLTPILKKYLDLTQTTINNVLRLGWAYNEPMIPLDMYDNKLKIKINVVKKNGKAISFNEFPFGNGTSIIKDVMVKGWNKSKNDVVKATFNNVKGHILDMTNGVAVFEQKGTDDRSKLDIERGFEQLWAEVYWSNGRVSCVPLVEIGNGVSYEHAEQSNSIFTITFDSDANDYGHAADVIHLRE